ncbi:hypothetical protein RFI_36549 [Reticulomyxa filosa]|uniref:Uncharacterized protein n=1 Tax=Reticulomyxa filosa TaxID=46433 RepID=X6LHT1_RETFI|nr:hypothetical protein RFI_36549 [Reticulomyxa filosa]|eukprot:ETO00891.1 hypothetical protein RFI_36549 [Reticulomyxa filosa]
MTQSLYVRKRNILDDLTLEEKNDTTNNETKENNGNNETNGTLELQKNSSLLPKQDKLFLVDRVKDHQLWKSEAFWKEAFGDSLQQEFKKYPMLQSWHSDTEHAEAHRRNQEIIFSQLAAITHNMKEFGMQNSTIVSFLDRQSLDPEKKKILKATLGIFVESTVVSQGDASLQSTQPTSSAQTPMGVMTSEMTNPVDAKPVKPPSRSSISFISNIINTPFNSQSQTQRQPQIQRSAQSRQSQPQLQLQSQCNCKLNCNNYNRNCKRNHYL